MDMSVVGTGYVGLVAGVCFADSGHRVICVDCDKRKIAQLRRGEIPIFEPGLKELVERNVKSERLEFTTDLNDAVKRSRAIFTAVGTPQNDDGSADISTLLDVAASIASAMDGYRVIINKSTVPVGTHVKVTAVIAERTEHPFDYVSNPEFMKEGAAVEDFMRPDRVVIGANSPPVVEIMREIYGSFMRRDERIFVMDPGSAEMTKYAANAMLATKIAFMNEMACLCERLGADVEAVRRGIGSDARIGSAFLYPGVGYGGSCFPKDVSALAAMGRQADQPMTIADAVDHANQRQRRVFAQRVIDHFGGDAHKTTVGVWGLAFKARTDDVREAPAIDAIRMFLDAGMTVRAHDPEAMNNAAAALKTTTGASERVTMCDDGYEALRNADALVIFTEWSKFRTPDFERMRGLMRQRVIFDGRNLFEPKNVAHQGFRYACIGRPSVPPK